jgi:uncharacterized protein (TIGR03067 family)
MIMKHHIFTITILACLLASSAQAEEESKESLAARLPAIKQSLANGNSAERLESINVLRRNRSLMSLMDDSFIDAWAACTKDKNVKVRREVARSLGYRWPWESGKEPNARAVNLILELSHDQDRQVRYNCVYHGLQGIPDKPDAIVQRLVDIGVESPYENNLYDAIGRGLRKNGEQAEKYLTRYLGEENTEEIRFRAYIMYTQFLRKQPPVPASLSKIGEYVIIFTRERSDNPMGDIESILPSDIEPYHAFNIKEKKGTSGVFKVKGIGTLESIATFFGEKNGFRLYAIWPASEFTLARIYRDQKPEYRIPAYAKQDTTTPIEDDNSHRIVPPGENTLVGTWTLTHDGQTMGTFRYDLSGGYEVHIQDRTLLASYVVDTKQSPMHLDVTSTNANGKSTTTRSIYDFLPNGDMRVAQVGPGKPRPDSFQRHVVYTRVHVPDAKAASGE